MPLSWRSAISSSRDPMAFRCRLLLLNLLFLPLLWPSVIGGDNPFSPRASLLRQWKRLFPSEQMPAILLKKASPLSAAQAAVFARYIDDSSLSTHLSAFCSAANLFCDLKYPPNVTRDISGDVDFESYNNNDFRRYQKGTVFGNDNFRNYSVDANVARDRFARYDQDGSGRETFVNYALSTNVAGSGFTQYNGNSNAGASSFTSYGKSSNVQGHDFTTYAAESSATIHDFTSYSEESNVVDNNFKGYGKDANAYSSTFAGYSVNSNVLTNSFVGYDASGNGAIGRFTSYGNSGNIARNDFRSYDEESNGAIREFGSYGESANQPGNIFISYGKGGNEPNESFNLYGNASSVPKNEFVEYNKDAGGAASLAFGTYVGDQTSFNQYSGTPGTFASYINSTQSSALPPTGVEQGKFFRRADLAKGKRIPMPDIRDKMPPRSFLPRDLAERMPFGSARLPELVKLLQAHSLQSSMAKTVGECERPAAKDETKRCVTSLEGMAEFAVSMLGKSAAVSTTESTVGWGKTLVMGAVAQRKGTAAVSCHQSLFPYLVYYCHAVPKVAVFDVELKETADGKTVNHGVAICHLDTSQWSAGHAAFLALGPAPGKIEVCHWIFENDLIWVARNV